MLTSCLNYRFSLKKKWKEEYYLKKIDKIIYKFYTILSLFHSLKLLNKLLLWHLYLVTHH